jgi:hypothetical protein
MIVFLLNGFGRFFKSQMFCGSNCLNPDIWRGLTSFLPKPREVLNFGRGYIKLNISLIGGYS